MWGWSRKSGANMVRIFGLPVTASAPSVPPWYEPQREMINSRVGSPRATCTCLANLIAVSTASEPLVM